MPRLKHEKSSMTYACPACDSGPIYQRTGNGNPQDDRPYLCEECGVSLNYIIERPKKNPGGSPTSPQRTLSSRYGITANKVEAMAPEDLGLSPIGVRGGAD